MSGFEAWAVRALAAGGLVLLAGYLLARLCRGPARRQAAVAWAVRGAVLAAAVAAFPGWLPVTLPAPPPAPVPAAEPAPTVWEWTGPTAFDDEPFEAVVDEAPAVEPTVNPVSPGWPAERWLAVGYGLVAVTLACRLLVGQLALVRLTRRASPAPPRVRQRFPGRVFVADRVASPVCFGLLRPTVLLPRGLAETASAGELDWVLAHEADHVARGDHRSAWWAAVAGCVFFPLPWFWAVRRELVLAQEFLADAAAAGDRPTEYAAFLVHLSAPPVRLPLLAAGVRAGRSDLSRRVTMLLNEGGGSRRASRRWRLLVGSGAVAGAVALGGLTVRQAAADEPKPVQVEVTVTADEPADKKPDGDKKKMEEVRRVRINADKTVTSPDVAKLKDEIKAAAKKGDAEAVAELVEKLEKALRATPSVIRLEGKMEPGATGSLRLTPGAGGSGDGRVTEWRPEWRFDVNRIDEAIKELQAQLDTLKDGNPQAKQAMEQALNALKGHGKTLRLMPDATWQKVPGAADPFAQKPRFGVGVGPVPEAAREQLDLPEAVGVVADEVRPDTPAAKAGVKKGDVIASFAGTDVSSDPTKFAEQVRAAKPGKVEVVVVRKGKKQTLTVDLPAAVDADIPKRRAEEEVKRAEEQRKRVKEQIQKRMEELDRKLTKAKPYDGGDFRSVSIAVTDGKFTAKATNAGIEYQITGRLDDGKAVPESIVVKEGSQTHEGKAISDIPENCRAALTRLLEKVSGPK